VFPVTKSANAALAASRTEEDKKNAENAQPNAPCHSEQSEEPPAVPNGSEEPSSNVIPNDSEEPQSPPENKEEDK
ncbi:MAG: hypothetical protein K2I20_04465, partial [Clostridia bacterium]|nr:hypothetical protein [Clostridia bacterium]